MKAAKAKSKRADTHTVTFRITEDQRQKLIELAIALGNVHRRHVSNNEAVQHMIDNSKPPKLGGHQRPEEELRTLTFRITSQQRQKLTDYALALSTLCRRHVSNNEGAQHMIDNSKAPKPRSERTAQQATGS